MVVTIVGLLGLLSLTIMSVRATFPELHTWPEKSTLTSEPVGFTVAVQSFDTEMAGAVEVLQAAPAVELTVPPPADPVIVTVLELERSGEG